MTVELDILFRFLIALVLGALVGAERERFARTNDNYLFGGLRTFMFISLFGALSAYIGSIYEMWFIMPLFAGLVVLLAISYHASVHLSKGKSIGLTAEITGVMMFILGLMCFTGNLIYPVVLAILITTLLYAKDKMHAFVKKVSREEMYGTLVFAIVVFVILPFLPNQTFGPLDVLNPYKIWLMVVLISGLGYVGYVLIKILGSHAGIGLTGFLGGLVSSTAVTMTFAGHSKKEKNLDVTRLFVFAVLIANAVMFLRVIIEVYIVNKSILDKLLIPMSVMFLVATISALVIWFRKGDAEASAKKTEVTHTSPFTLGPAVKFGLLFGVVLFVVKLAEVYFGDTGLYIASLVSGFVDVDAITLSMANLAGTTISEKVAATSITLAVMSNTIIKFGYAAIFGSKAFRKRIGIVFGLVLAAGLLSLLFI
jgi:uncharacterized membrane protein (DUF4010 family)